MTNKLKYLLQQYYNSEIIEVNKVTSNVTLFTVSNKKYIIKFVTPKCRDIYDFLITQNATSISYPIKKFTTKEGMYYLYNYEEELKFPIVKKTQHLIEAINELHNTTAYEKKLSNKNFKYLFRTYKKLDYKFQMLEMYIREAEVKQSKTDFEWVILSKYSVFLDVKMMMYSLQKKIHNYVDDKIGVVYCLNHGDPNLNHLYNKKLISFDNAYQGIFVSDLAKLYVSCDHINIDWYSIINQIIEPYENKFYKIYFKFLVLYIYMINVDFDFVDVNNACNKYIQINRKITIFLKNFESYK